MNNTGVFYSSFTRDTQRYSAEDRRCIESVIGRLMQTSTSEDRPGMLLGKIQSGKTKTFLAIMALAFDNEFDVAVVLTKGTKALSKQTYERISAEFKAHNDADRLKVFDIMNIPSQLTGFELSQKLVLVVKKQVDNLNRLLELFDTKYPQLKSKRALIVDDEADYASVGFRKDGEGLDINGTAHQLEQLRSLVERAAFLQVTATPYSLYLQPDDVQVKGNSFKPIRPAFTELVPVNAAYIGSDFYFSDPDDSADPALRKRMALAKYLYEPVSEDELLVLRKQDGRRLKLDDVLTSKSIPSLRDAICNFLVGGCIRRLQDMRQERTPKKFSFLVHTEPSMAAHTWQETLVERIKSHLTAALSTDRQLFEALIERAYADIAASVQAQGSYLPPFADVLQEVAKALQSDYLMITKVNAEKQIGELLDSDGQLKLRTPLNIFIGGQILDRGITIANLIGFYYGRRPNVFQQDTVLQHSRMFGFRPQEDLAVTRFYTEPRIHNAMRCMHESDVALREALAKNPEQPVVFIQKAPGDGVQPCSPNKIALSRTTTLKPHKRILPVGFQTLAKTNLKPITGKLDKKLEAIAGELALDRPMLVDVQQAIELLDMTEPAFEFVEGYDFDWQAARSSLTYLAGLNQSGQANKVWLMTYTDRNVSRLAKETSHAEFIEPDSTRTEGLVRKAYATDNPILILIRQNGKKEQGWMDGPFWWPVISAQQSTQTAIFAHETRVNE